MTAPAGWISFELDASAPTWISVIECEGTEAVFLATDNPHAGMYLTGGRYLVYADGFTADATIARVTANSLPAAPPLRQEPPPGLLSHAPGGSHRGTRAEVARSVRPDL